MKTLRRILSGTLLASAVLTGTTLPAAAAPAKAADLACYDVYRIEDHGDHYHIYYIGTYCD